MNAYDDGFSEIWRRTIEEYEAKFGVEADPQWFEGDHEKYIAMLRKAIETNTPLPDYYEANNIPKNALT